MSHAPRQLAFALEHRAAQGRADFMVSEANREALGLVESWQGWPDGRLAVSGEAGAGKSHLAQVWVHLSDAVVVAADRLSVADAAELAAHGQVVVEDGDRLASLTPEERAGREDALFHLLNLLKAEGGSILITGRTPPVGWPVLRRDLGSRLAAMTVARIAAPDDTLLSAILVKLFSDRQLRVEPDVIEYLVDRMERSFEAAGRMVETLDKAALQRHGKITKRLAGELFGWTQRRA